MELNALLATPAILPSLPRAVALLMSELAHEEPNLRRVNQLFGTDPALAARLLEKANSDAFAGPRTVAGISEALALLGTADLRELVSTAPLGTASRSVPGLNLQQFWRYSLAAAKFARSLAGSVHHSQAAAYTAGLLHGIGELLIHQADPERVQSLNTLVAPLDPRRAKLEGRIFGYCYNQVSAGLAERWQLPEAVVDALKYQHAPFEKPHLRATGRCGAPGRVARARPRGGHGRKGNGRHLPRPGGPAPGAGHRHGAAPGPHRLEPQTRRIRRCRRPRPVPGLT
jgi:HD-like signal output (HDOD) protein